MVVSGRSLPRGAGHRPRTCTAPSSEASEGWFSGVWGARGAGTLGMVRSATTPLPAQALIFVCKELKTDPKAGRARPGFQVGWSVVGACAGPGPTQPKPTLRLGEAPSTGTPHGDPRVEGDLTEATALEKA